MKWPIWRLFGFVVLVLGSPAGGASPPPTSTTMDRSPGQQIPLNLEVTIQKTVSLSYLRFLPAAYDPSSDRKWPLLIFLHGAGERGHDLQLVTKHGPPRLVKERPDFPFIVISPQCREGETWEVDALEALLDDALKHYAVDPQRVCLTGLSMGGYGTWAWAAAHPERFAAVVPICGGGNPIGVWLSGGPRREALTRLPIWAFHGAKDTVVPLEESRRMIDAFQRLGNTPKLTIFPEAGHDSWTAAYQDPGLFDWLLQQHRP